MKLQEIFNQLMASELTQASVGGEAPGKITAANQHIVISHINLGLTDLFQRFLLKEGKFKLLTDVSMRSYLIDRAFARSNLFTLKPFKYIDDLASPFMDDLAKIHCVKTEKGDEVPVNDASKPWSLSNPSSHVLEFPLEVLKQSSEIPDWLITPYFEVTYRASHPLIDASEAAALDPNAVDVHLPYSYLRALLLFVASRVYGPVGQGAEGSLGAMYEAKYEVACKKLESYKLDIDTSIANHSTKFHDRGWC